MENNVKVEKNVLLIQYKAVIEGMLGNTKVQNLPDYMVEDLKKLIEKHNSIEEME